MEIAFIPADHLGNKLILKEPRKEGDRLFVKYRSTLNDMPFTESELYPADGGANYVITGEDGTVFWRFSINWINKLID